ncbi:hypothetical protein DMENIID0001_077220 [Sergentomyia squamirostris]
MPDRVREAHVTASKSAERLTTMSSKERVNNLREAEKRESMVIEHFTRFSPSECGPASESWEAGVISEIWPLFNASTRALAAAPKNHSVSSPLSAPV